MRRIYDDVYYIPSTKQQNWFEKGASMIKVRQSCCIEEVDEDERFTNLNKVGLVGEQFLE